MSYAQILPYLTIYCRLYQRREVKLPVEYGMQYTLWLRRAAPTRRKPRSRRTLLAASLDPKSKKTKLHSFITDFILLTPCTICYKYTKFKRLSQYSI